MAPTSKDTEAASCEVVVYNLAHGGNGYMGSIVRMVRNEVAGNGATWYYVQNHRKKLRVYWNESKLEWYAVVRDDSFRWSDMKWYQREYKRLGENVPASGN